MHPSGTYLAHHTRLYGLLIKILALIFWAAIKPHFCWTTWCDAHPIM